MYCRSAVQATCSLAGTPESPYVTGRDAPASLANLNGLLVAVGEPLVQTAGPEEPAVGTVQGQGITRLVEENNHVTRRVPAGLLPRRGITWALVTPADVVESCSVTLTLPIVERQ